MTGEGWRLAPIPHPQETFSLPEDDIDVALCGFYEVTREITLKNYT